MQHNFYQIVPRRGTSSYKWDSEHAAFADDVLPLWVADMDFAVAPCIQQALQQRLDHGIFGYTSVPAAYYERLARWFETRHGWSGITAENTIYTIGVVPAISAILQGLRRVRGYGQALVMSPVYNCFYSCIRNSGYALLESPLSLSSPTPSPIKSPHGLKSEGTLKNGKGEEYWVIDWANLETQMEKADVLLLCNPHNPVGRVWTREELTRLATMAAEHEVFVVSDEIHCEFTFPGSHRYTPFATTIQQAPSGASTSSSAASTSALGTSTNGYAVLTSPSKAFNIAGLQIANIYAPDAQVREVIDKQININEVCDVNPFGPVALMAAYSDEGAAWLNELNEYIYQNYLLLRDWVATQPHLRLTRMEGTYLAWIKSGAIDGDTLCQHYAEQAHVLLNEGSMYGEAGRDYVRLNLACPRSVLLEALERMENGKRKIEN